MMRRFVCGWVVFLMVLFLSSSVMVFSASSVLIPAIYMTPSENPPAKGIGYKWNVTIWLSAYGVSAVHGWSVRLNYDGVAGGINVSRAWVADFDSLYIFAGRASAKPRSVIASQSSVLVHDELLEQPGVAVSGEVKLAVVEFVILKAPGKYETKTTVLNIINQDTYLLAELSRTIPISAENGVYTWMWLTTVLPFPDIVPSVVVERQLNRSFSVELIVRHADWGMGLIRGLFNLTYDSSLIELVGVTVNRTVWDGAVAVESGLGAVHLSVGATSVVYEVHGGSVPVADLEFKVIGFGLSHIVMSEVQGFSSGFEIFYGYNVPGSLVVAGIRNGAVTGVALNASQVRRGDTVSVDVTVQNRGNCTDSFEVTTFYASAWKVPNAMSILVPVETQAFVDLSPNEYRTLTFLWNTSDVASSEYVIMAGVSPLEGESDQSDNFLTSEGTVSFMMLGDINRDFRVDIRDLARAALAFGSHVGEPRWDYAADLNQDGTVDIRDLVIVAKNFGR